MILISIFLPIFIGASFTQLLWHDRLFFKRTLFLKLSISVGLGFGISSCIFFMWLVVFNQYNNGFIIVEVFLFVLLAALNILRKERNNSNAFLKSETEKNKDAPAIFFYIIFLLSFIFFIIITIKMPHGDWDAWAVWNMRARFLFRGGEYWKDGFSKILYWSNLDYPLLVPGLVARCWKFAGNGTALVPQAISMLFTFSTVCLLFSSISVIKGRIYGLLASTVLLGTSFFVLLGASQYADVPFSFFSLSVIALFFIKDIFPEDQFGLSVLIGLMSGLGAWTKNEGLLFLFFIVIARFAALGYLKNIKIYFKELIPFSLGFMPIFAIVIYFKTHIAPPLYLLREQHGFFPTFEKITSISRHAVILKGFIKHFTSFDLSITSPVYILIIFGVLCGIKIKKEHEINILTAVTALCLMLTSYYFIFLSTSRDLIWHMGTSLDRLLLQIWPAFIFIYFMIIENNGEPQGDSASGNIKK